MQNTRSGTKDSSMRILVADHQEKVQLAFSALIFRQPGWKIVGSAANIESLLEEVMSLKPDVVLLDSSLPGMQLGRLVSAVRQSSNGTLIVAMSTYPGKRKEVLSSGVDFFVSKVDSPEKLLETLAWCEEIIVSNSTIDE